MPSRHRVGQAQQPVGIVRADGGAHVLGERHVVDEFARLVQRLERIVGGVKRSWPSADIAHISGSGENMPAPCSRLEQGG